MTGTPSRQTATETEGKKGEEKERKKKKKKRNRRRGFVTKKGTGVKDDLR